MVILSVLVGLLALICMVDSYDIRGILEDIKTRLSELEKKAITDRK